MLQKLVTGGAFDREEFEVGAASSMHALSTVWALAASSVTVNWLRNSSCAKFIGRVRMDGGIKRRLAQSGRSIKGKNGLDAILPVVVSYVPTCFVRRHEANISVQANNV